MGTGSKRQMGAEHLIAIAVVLVGCGVDDLDLQDKECPCAPGYVCDTALNRCMRSSARDAGPDSGDASALDVGVPADASGDALMDGAPVDGDHDGSVDGAMDDPSTACDDLLADALFCESFEDPELAPWTITEEMDGVVEHQTSEAFRGEGALHATTSLESGHAERIAPVLDSITDGELHLRAYVNIPSGYDVVHVNLLHIGRHREGGEMEILSGFNVFDNLAGMFIGAGVFTLNPMLVTIPRDAWFCVQIDMVIDDVAGSARISIDGELAGEVMDIDTRADAPYVHVGAGLSWTAGDQPPAELYIDELAVGRAVLPCEP